MTREQRDDILNDVSHAARAEIKSVLGIELSSDDLDAINDFFSDFLSQRLKVVVED